MGGEEEAVGGGVGAGGYQVEAGRCCDGRGGGEEDERKGLEEGRMVGRRFIVEVKKLRGCFPRCFKERVGSEEYCSADVSAPLSCIKNQDNEGCKSR